MICAEPKAFYRSTELEELLDLKSLIGKLISESFYTAAQIQIIFLIDYYFGNVQPSLTLPVNSSFALG